MTRCALNLVNLLVKLLRLRRQLSQAVFSIPSLSQTFSKIRIVFSSLQCNPIQTKIDAIFNIGIGNAVILVLHNLIWVSGSERSKIDRFSNKGSSKQLIYLALQFVDCIDIPIQDGGNFIDQLRMKTILPHSDRWSGYALTWWWQKLHAF